MHDLQALYTRYLEGQCTREELERLLLHFREGEVDPALVHQMEEVLREVAPAPWQQQDSAALERLLHENHLRIKQAIQTEATAETEPGANTRTRSIRSLIRYAAAAVLLIAVSISLYRYQTHTQTGTPMSIAQDILPGSYRAVLKLDDGQQLLLSEDQEGIILTGEDMRYEDGSAIAGGDRPATQYVSLQTPRAGQYRVTLSDGTKVWLNAASSLRYPTQFAGTHRTVELEGEAYFEVAHHPKQPFIVQSGQQKVQVLGTAFNIQAYGDETKHHTTLVTGSVQVSRPDGAHRLTIQPGQQVLSTPGDPLSVRQVDVQDYTAWVDGAVILANYDLEEVMRQLERWYDVEFSALPASSSSKRVYGVLSRTAPLGDVLEVLQINYDIRFSLEGRRIQVQPR